MFSIDLRRNRVEPWFLQRLIHPTFSPDGRLVAAVKLPCQVVLIDIKQQRQRDCVRGHSWWPSFFSDGDHISYMSHEPRPFTIWTQSLSGSEKRQITSLEKGDNLAEVSPASKELAYLSHLYKGIAVRRLDGDMQVLAQTSIDGFPKWSPDGQLIAIVNRRSAVWIIDRLARGRMRVSDPGTRLSDTCAWSPDGKQLVFHVSDKTNPKFQFISLDTREILRLIQTKHSSP